uniref:Ig-like domain-containing protein n=1 Tax=Poecilia latipinna TaxID=48699 RepID=A0A3B3V5I8_9TELE
MFPSSFSVLSLLFCVSSDALVVTQSPDVSVQEGETGNISCCFKGTAERVRITWLKNQTLIKNKTDIDQSTGFHIEQKNKCSVLIIETMTRSDSGKYICKVTVEIPVLKEVEGNGTTITVRARENPSDSTDHQPDNADHHSLNGITKHLNNVQQLLSYLVMLVIVGIFQVFRKQCSKVIYEIVLFFRIFSKKLTAQEMK